MYILISKGVNFLKAAQQRLGNVILLSFFSLWGFGVYFWF